MDFPEWAQNWMPAISLFVLFLRQQKAAVDKILMEGFGAIAQAQKGHEDRAIDRHRQATTAIETLSAECRTLKSKKSQQKKRRIFKPKENQKKGK